MIKYILALTFSVGALHCSIAQTYKITGRVCDENNKPLEFANILIGKAMASQPFKSVASDSLGYFTFENILPDTYRIAAIMLGYTNGLTVAVVTDNNIKLDDLSLMTDIRQLGEVVVTSSIPFIEQKVDKVVVNVATSVLSSGSTALEVLQRVPGIVILNDKVEIAGKNKIGIMIDGKLSQYIDMNNVLRDMPSSNIEKIEVITNPSAKYDATGGAIINIITKKDKALGFNGSIVTNSGYAYFDQTNINSTDNFYYRLSPSINLNYRGKKWYTFGFYNLSKRTAFDITNIHRFVDNTEFNATTYNPTLDWAHNYRAGFDWFINSKNTVGLVVNGFSKTGENHLSNTTDYIYKTNSEYVTGRFFTNNDTRNTRYNFSISTNYKYSLDSLGQELTLDADYLSYELNNNSIIQTTPSVSKSIRQQGVVNPIQVTTLKMDYTKPFKKDWIADLGMKISSSKINNELTFKNNGYIDSLRSNYFLYQEDISAAYFNLQKKWEAWRFQGGVRYEQTRALGSNISETLLNRRYGQFFYNAYISRKLVSQLALNLSFNQRIARPSFQQQNPFEFFMDSLSSTKGNPFLKPQKTSSAKLSLTFAGSPCFALSYNHTDDIIFENAPLQEGNKTYTVVDNLGKHESINIEANFPIMIGKVVSGYGGNQVIMNRYDVTYLGGVYNRKKWNWLGYLQMNIKLSKTFTAEFYGYYMTPFMREFMIVQRSATINVGLQKSLWDKQGKITLNINDILYTNPIKADLNYQNIRFQYSQRNDSRNVRLTFSYTFGNKQMKQRKEKSSASESEQSRIKLN